MSIDDFIDHLYTYLYVYMLVSGIMARLYWRVKQAGRWTWKAASVVHQEWTADELTVYIDNVPGKGEEE